MQRVFKVLGTPKLMGFTKYLDLPLAPLLGHYVVDDSGKKSDVRERICKALAIQLPQALQTHPAFPSHAVDSEPSPTHPVLAFLKASLSLNPSSRQSVSSLRCYPFSDRQPTQPLPSFSHKNRPIRSPPAGACRCFASPALRRNASRQ